MTFLSVTHHICTYILGENRSSIQSLMLMRLAISKTRAGKGSRDPSVSGSCKVLLLDVMGSRQAVDIT